MAEACHNCRRNRLKCDRTSPCCLKCTTRGQECLGYQRLLRWETGVASRGKMTGVTLSKKPSNTLRPMNLQALPAKTLTDPLMQDMNTENRRYLYYFASDVCKDLVLYDNPKDNRFRELIPLTHSHPVLLHIIVANSAIRMSHTDHTCIDWYAKTGSTPSSTDPTAFGRHDFVPHSRARSDALAAKHRALYILQSILTGAIPVETDVTLATVLLFIEYELLDSARDNWTHHINGARKIIEKLCGSDVFAEASMSPLRKFLISNCLVFDILGSTLACDTSLAPVPSLSNTTLSLLQDAEGNHCSSFPTILLRVMWSASRLSRSEPFPSNSEPHSAFLQEQVLLLLYEAKSFDPHAWAKTLQPRSPSSDLSHRTHVAFAHRAAVCIYLSRLLLSLDPKIQLTCSPESWVSEAIGHMACVRPYDALFTATTWPAFIAGAETNDLGSRAWIAQRFAELWEVEPWGTISGALGVLRGIWLEKREGALLSAKGEPYQDMRNGDWIAKLRQTGVDWLII